MLDVLKKQMNPLKVFDEESKQQPLPASEKKVSLKDPMPSQGANTDARSVSFEQVYQTSYSHGLEDIYALERVDLKTVRFLQGAIQASRPIHVSEKQKRNCSRANDQLEFDFGDPYRGWIESFVLSEPIQVIGLSQSTEKSLNENGKMILKDLVEADLKEFVFYKGMGQGHIDEIAEKLKRYIDGREIHRYPAVDFIAWVRSLTGEVDRKKTFVLLQNYGLSEFFSLSPAENVEVRRLTLEKKQEWIEEVKKKFQIEDKKRIFLQTAGRIVDVFIRPWIERRNGFATKQEILERIEMISDREKVAMKVLQFFSDIYLDGTFPFLQNLYSFDGHLYFSDRNVLDDHLLIVEKARSYFYHPSVCYPFHQLTAWICRECALFWKGFPEGFLEKTLRFSNDFRVRRGLSGDLFIRLS